MLLLLLSHFSRVRLYATPETAAHQAPLSLGFSRQEHWSGLPFPSPMHERKSESEVAQLSPNLRDPVDFTGKSTRVGCHCLLQLTRWLSGKESACTVDDAGDTGWDPGEGNGNTLQYSCLENPMDKGAIAGFDRTQPLNNN